MTFLDEPLRTKEIEPCSYPGCKEYSEIRGLHVYECVDGHLTCAICQGDVRNEGRYHDLYVCDSGCDHGA